MARNVRPVAIGLVSVHVACLACGEKTVMPPDRDIWMGWSLSHRWPVILGCVLMLNGRPVFAPVSQP